MCLKAPHLISDIYVLICAKSYKWFYVLICATSYKWFCVLTCDFRWVVRPWGPTHRNLYWSTFCRRRSRYATRGVQGSTTTHQPQLFQMWLMTWQPSWNRVQGGTRSSGTYRTLVCVVRWWGTLCVLSSEGSHPFSKMPWYPKNIFGTFQNGRGRWPSSSCWDSSRVNKVCEFFSDIICVYMHAPHLLSDFMCFIAPQLISVVYVLICATSFKCCLCAYMLYIL